MSSAPYEATFLDPTDETVGRDWASLLKRSEQATPFSTLDYADAVREVLDLDYRLAGIYANVSNDKQLVGGVLCYEKPLGPYRRVVVPPLTAYTSFLFDPPLRETDINQRRSPLDALLDLLEAHYHELSFSLHPSLTDTRTFVWRDWRVTPRYTHQQHPLIQKEDLLMRFSKSTRKLFRSENEYFHMRETVDAAATTASFIEKAYAHQDLTPPLSSSQYVAFVEKLYDAGLARVFAIDEAESSTPKGGQSVLLYGNVGYSWTGASERGPADALLNVNIMLQLEDESFTGFDFMGANIDSVAEFKRKFGAPLVTYFHVGKRRPELKLLRQLRF